MTTDKLKNYIVGQKIALYDHNTQKFLILKAKKPKGKKYEDFWKRYFPHDLPGGRVEEGENLAEGLTRDVTEEIGEEAQYTLGPIIDSQELTYTDEIVIANFYLAHYQGGEIILSEEHEGFEWLTGEEIESHADIKPWIKQIITRATERLTEQSYLTDLKRSQSDFENYKRRQKESEGELKSFLSQRVIEDILPVLDNFQQATSFVPEEQVGSPWITGITYIQKQLEDTLATHGLSVISVNIGDTFDPSIHEAIEKESGNDEDKKAEAEKGGGGKVTKIHSQGYKLGTRIIKPARVNVS
jgi:molecular chaperone GrpE